MVRFPSLLSVITAWTDRLTIYRAATFFSLTPMINRLCKSTPNNSDRHIVKVEINRIDLTDLTMVKLGRGKDLISFRVELLVIDPLRRWQYG